MLRNDVIKALTEALKDEGPDNLERFLSAPPDPQLGDLAFGCFALAKTMRRPPAEVAKELAGKITPSGLIRSVEAAGPYLNFRAHTGALLEATCRAVDDGSLFAAARVDKPQKVMIEFSQPNTHKPFHVGHLRNVALGDSLVRLHRARGHEVIAANYYGDFGIDVAKCLWWLKTHPELVAPDEDRTTFLGMAYVAANEQLDPKKVDPETAARNLAEVREILHGMERRQPEIWALYQQTRQWCLDEFAETYRWLDVQFDVEFFESQVEDEAAAIVESYLQKGVFERSDGAVICRLEPELDVPAVVRKSDGTSLYLTWDLALAKRKFDEHDIERSLYVVGSEQKFHFKQLFLTLQRMGYERAKDCEHVAYELVVLPEGKMSSRTGTAIPLHRLKQEVCAAIAPRMQIDEPETLRRIAVACLKYGMLRVGTNKRVVFSIDSWTNPQGDTGAYLLYSVARIRSIFRKAGEEVDLGSVSIGGTFGEAPEERGLLNHLLQWPAVVERAASSSDPSSLATWLYEGARAFSQFFENCQVLRAEPELRRARLALIRATDVVMTRGLELLGITPVDAM